MVIVAIKSRMKERRGKREREREKEERDETDGEEVMLTRRTGMEF